MNVSFSDHLNGLLRQHWVAIHRDLLEWLLIAHSGRCGSGVGVAVSEKAKL
jgi:hypothetical protein